MTTRQLFNDLSLRQFFLPELDLKDLSLWLLLISNGITIYFAVTQGWSLSMVMWIYWFQSVTIGFFNFIRILTLKDYSTEGFVKTDDLGVSPRAVKTVTAFFFLFHYGFFHLVYAIFLGIGTLRSMEGKYVFLSAAIFFVNHLFSFFYNRPKDTKKQNIGELMAYPYARILPMHLTIVFGVVLSFLGLALPFFLVLKTLADISMHTMEHEVLWKGEEKPAVA